MCSIHAKKEMLTFEKKFTMRYIKDIPNPKFKISLYQWNNKYIIKMESEMFEQTYKIDQYEVENIEELEKCLDTTLLEAVLSRFDAMNKDFTSSLTRNEIIF